jgi:hypothetical protein
MPYPHILCFWLLLLVLAASLGAIRDKLIIPRLGESPGRAIMTLAFIGCVFVAAWMLNALTQLTPRQALAAGLIWLALTVAWEMFMGRVLMKLSWKDIFADYNILKGRLWPLVLAATLTAPYLMR